MLIKALFDFKDTPLPVILVVGGLLFIALAIIAKTQDFDIPPKRQWVASFLGFLLLVSGILLYLTPTIITIFQASPVSPVKPGGNGNQGSSLQVTAPVSPIQVPVGTVLIDENFEDNTFSRLMLSGMTGRWSVEKDEIGNHVFEIKTDSDHAGIRFGSANWKNYSVDYRVRLLKFTGDSPVASLYFRNTDNTSAYIQSITPYYKSFDLTFTTGGPWQSLAGADNILFGRDIWYKVRVIVEGPRIRLYLDDILRTDWSDARFSSGNLRFEVTGNADVQFDDIRVVALDSASRDN